MLLKRNFRILFIRLIYSFKRLNVLKNLVNVSQLLTESAAFSSRNRLFGAKLRPGSGTEFKDLATSLLVFTLEAL